MHAITRMPCSLHSERESEGGLPSEGKVRNWQGIGKGSEGKGTKLTRRCSQFIPFSSVSYLIACPFEKNERKQKASAFHHYTSLRDGGNGSSGRVRFPKAALRACCSIHHLRRAGKLRALLCSALFFSALLLLRSALLCSSRSARFRITASPGSVPAHQRTSEGSKSLFFFLLFFFFLYASLSIDASVVRRPSPARPPSVAFPAQFPFLFPIGSYEGRAELLDVAHARRVGKLESSTRVERKEKSERERAVCPWSISPHPTSPPVQSCAAVGAELRSSLLSTRSFRIHPASHLACLSYRLVLSSIFLQAAILIVDMIPARLPTSQYNCNFRPCLHRIQLDPALPRYSS